MVWGNLTARHKKILAVSVSSLVLTGAVSSAVIWWRTRRVLQESVSQAVSAGEYRFTLGPLKRPANPGFIPISASAEFQSITEFDGALYVCSRSALFQYNMTGRLLHTWFVGQDLPPYPLVSLTVRRGIPQPELWIATNGAGVLIWDGQRLRQLRPAEAELCKVTSFLPLSNGFVLWGTLNKGIYSTNGRQFTVLHPELANIHATAIAGSEDDVWIGTRGEGVWHWRAGTVNKFAAELPDPQVPGLSLGGNASGSSRILWQSFAAQTGRGSFCADPPGLLGHSVDRHGR
jgi:hypothetical protein